MVQPSEIELPPVGLTLGFRVIALQDGSATIEMPGDDRFLNRAGGVQGGILAALGDSSMAISLRSTEGPQETHATLELRIHFFRPAAKENGPFRATGRVLHRSRRIAHVESEIRDSSEELIAKTVGTFAIRQTEGTPPPPRE